VQTISTIYNWRESNNYPKRFTAESVVQPYNRSIFRSLSYTQQADNVIYQVSSCHLKLSLRRIQWQHAAAETTRFPVSAAAAPPVLDRADGLLHEGCLVQPNSSQDAGVLCHAERRDDADERQDNLRLLSGLFRERRVRRLQPQGTTASLPTVRVAVHQSLAHSRLHLLRSETCCLSVVISDNSHKLFLVSVLHVTNNNIKYGRLCS